MRHWLSWQLGLLIALSLLFGFTFGVGISLKVFSDDMASVGGELASKTARVQLLEMLIQQYSEKRAILALDAPSAASAGTAGAGGLAVPVKPVLAAPSPSTVAVAPPPVAKVVIPVQPGPAIPVAAAPPTSVQAPKPKPNASPSIVGSGANASPVSAASPPAQPVVTPITGGYVPPVQKITGEELIDAVRKPIEGVNADKAGVKGVDREGVTLKNGSKVRVGDFFPSGERLLLVDAENSRVVTDKRQMLLFFSTGN